MIRIITDFENGEKFETVYLQEYDPDLVEKSTRLVGMDVDLADPYTMLWEERVINALLGIAQEYERDGYMLLPNIARR